MWQIGGGADRLIGDGPITDDGADDGATALSEDPDESVEIRAGEEPLAYHGTGSACCA
jgi:hypothetical protein